MDDQLSVASSIRDPFGLQRRQYQDERDGNNIRRDYDRLHLHQIPNSLKENTINQPTTFDKGSSSGRNSVPPRGRRNDDSSLYTSLHQNQDQMRDFKEDEQIVRQNHHIVDGRSLLSADGNILSRDRGTYSDQSMMNQHLQTISRRRSYDDEEEEDDNGKISRKKDKILESVTGFERGLLYNSNNTTRQLHQNTKWNGTEDTLRTVTEDFDDSDDNGSANPNLEFQTRSRYSLETAEAYPEEEIVFERDLDSHGHIEKAPTNSFRSVYGANQTNSQFSNESTVVQQYHSLKPIHQSLHLNSSLEEKRSKASPILNKINPTGIESKARSPGKSNVHSKRWENGNVSYNSPSHTAISQLSSSPIDRELVKDDLHKNRVNMNSLWTGMSSTKNSGNSNVAEPFNAQNLTSKMISQLQSQLEEYQQELARVSHEKYEAIDSLQEMTQKFEQLQSSLQNSLEEKSFNDSKQKQALEKKELELLVWEESLKRESEIVQRQRDELNRRKTSINGLEKTVHEIETTHRDEQAQLNSWQEKLRVQQADVKHDLELLDSQRQDLERQKLKWEAEKHNRESELISQERRLAGWEKRLRQNEEQLQQQHHSLNQMETSLLQERQELQSDRKELDFSLSELETISSRTEAKLQRMEQTLQEITAKQQEEQQRLQEIYQRRQDQVEVAEREAEEWEETKASLDLDTQASRQQLQILEKQVEAKRKEMTAALNQFHAMLTEHQKIKEAKEKETELADQRLSAILDQLEVAQREKSNLENSVREKQKTAEEIQHHMEQEEQRWKVEQGKLQSERLELEKLRLESNRDSELSIRNGMIRLQAYADEVTSRHNQTREDLDRRMTQIEELQRKLDKVAVEYKEKFMQLQDEKSICQSLQEKLNERLRNIAMDEDQRRQACDEHVNRLQHRLDTELSQRQNSIDTAIKEAREESTQQIRDLREKLEFAESELDLCRIELDSLRLKVIQQNDETSTERHKFDEAYDKLKQELSVERQRSERAELTVQNLQSDKRTEKLEIESLKTKLNRLESQLSCLENAKIDWESERSRLQANAARMDIRLTTLKEKEQQLADEDEKIERKRRQLQYGFRQLVRQKQKTALSRFFTKPLRSEQEAVSAAFSKWVRTTMFRREESNRVGLNESIEQTLSTLQREKDEALGRQERLEIEREEFVESERQMQHELKARQRDYEDRCRDMQGEIKWLRQEQLKLMTETKLQTHDRESNSDGASSKILAEREKELKRREEELATIQQRFQEHQQKTAHEFEIANERIRRMAERLSHKEKDIELKQRQLELEKVDITRKEQKLRRLSETSATRALIPSPTRNLLLFDDNLMDVQLSSPGSQDDAWFSSKIYE